MLPIKGTYVVNVAAVHATVPRNNVSLAFRLCDADVRLATRGVSSMMSAGCREEGAGDNMPSSRIGWKYCSCGAVESLEHEEA